MFCRKNCPALNHQPFGSKAALCCKHATTKDSNMLVWEEDGAVLVGQQKGLLGLLGACDVVEFGCIWHLYFPRSHFYAFVCVCCCAHFKFLVVSKRHSWNQVTRCTSTSITLAGYERKSNHQMYCDPCLI